jgi:hypothetical protein
LQYVLFKHDATIGIVSTNIVSREVVATNEYTVFDLVRPESDQERATMLSRAGERYRPVFCEHRERVKDADCGLCIVQASDTDFVLFCQDADAYTFHLLEPSAIGPWTIFDARRPTSIEELKQRKSEWCECDGMYVPLFRCETDIWV